MQNIKVRDNQVVLVLNKAELKELRHRLKSGFGVRWSKNTLSLDIKASDEMERLGMK